MARAGFSRSAAILCLSFFIQMAMATQFLVGDSHGWSNPSSSGVSYSKWALEYSFYVGDILVFNYSSETDNVLEVNRVDFVDCIPGNPISVHSAGTTEFRLTRGARYFICGMLNHCSEGQKLSIIAQKGTEGHGIAKAPVPAPAKATSSTTNLIASQIPILASCIILVASSFFF